MEDQVWARCSSAGHPPRAGLVLLALEGRGQGHSISRKLHPKGRL